MGLDADFQNITVYIKGNYSSPAVTATHIHEAVRGRAGPPRIAFPNPVPINGEPLDQFSWRRSVGCLTGPFRTGVITNGSEYNASFTFTRLLYYLVKTVSGHRRGLKLIYQATPVPTSPSLVLSRTLRVSLPTLTLSSSPLEPSEDR